jgi:4-hydroxy-3-methylbut-2-enyl diphosphate reductase
MKSLHDCKVLIRAHGEPPETYQLALENNIELIDASCPVVLKLQHRIKHSFDQMLSQDGQVVIYGQKGHAEVIGLIGQTQNQALVVSSEDDLEQIDFHQPVSFFSQTTKSTEGFYNMKALLETKFQQANPEGPLPEFDANDSICRQVSNREPQLEKFAAAYQVIIFVSGKKSSNGKALYGVCKANNPNSYFVENETELDPSWFEGIQSVGICGATSTPMWLMEQVAIHIRQLDTTLSSLV